MTTAATESTILSRSEVPAAETWELEAIYKTPKDWEADFDKVSKLLVPVLEMKGKLLSPKEVEKVFRAEDALHQLLDRLYTYAHLREDEDTSNSTNQARQQRISGKIAEVMGKTAWIRPEILSHTAKMLGEWRNSRELQYYRRTMDELIRQKPHMLSNQEETLLSKASEIFRTPYTVFGYLTNADMTFPPIKDEKGIEQPLSNGRYVRFLENRDRDVRKRAFETFYDTYISHKNTLSASLASNVKFHNYNASIRNYDSALHASLQPDNISVDLYNTLIDATHEALPSFYEYVTLRKELLGVSHIDMYDMHVPIVPDFEISVDWKEAKEWVAESLKPLGGHYANGIGECLNQRWIDVYENKGKRSGAYSGGCYGTYPYILMNFQGTLDHVYTLAHEMGHSLHSWLANATQPYRYADYTIFVAEIASTTNEALLHQYLLEKTDNPRFRAYLLNHLCDAFKGTVFRQVMFAEFEKVIHEMDQEGKPLTAESLSEVYYELNAKFYGSEVKADQRIAYEWSRVPHFYYNFYVYKYATGFCAAQLFARRIQESEEYREMYLDMLRAGGSKDSLDLVKDGGVDLLDREVLTSAFSTFRDSVRQLKELLTSSS